MGLHAGGCTGGPVDKEPADFIEFQVPFRDVDMHGEMFRSVYVTKAEEALAVFWKRRPSAWADPYFFVRKVTCSFHTPLQLAVLVRMYVHVRTIGTTSADFLFRI